jgi:chemotaxis protein CheY-P-specific phosphatase CheC
MIQDFGCRPDATDKMRLSSFQEAHSHTMYTSMYTDAVDECMHITESTTIEALKQVLQDDS